MKMNWKTLIFAGVPALVCAAIFAGCVTYDNNYLRPEDFAVYLEREGVKEVRLSADIKRYRRVDELLHFLELSTGVRFEIKDKVIFVK